MSKLKNPRAKKAASLSRDRRNVHGENSKASRKSIPRAKARKQRAHRRAVHQALVHAEPLVSDVEVEATENKLSKAARVRQVGFRKQPDVPLGEVLEGKRPRRTK
jgi:hypothetical protein